ncbi:MAG TPA: SOS response-associated peptidase family protein [Paucimonas sp.]|nr:SOS response-associated peptidase family protein [Paucimonas sp.]
MCANFLTANKSVLTERFHVEAPGAEYEAEVFPGHFAPFIACSRAKSSYGQKRCAVGRFGLVAPWTKIEDVRETHNARSEGVESKPSYRNAVQQGQFCVVPVAAMFEWRHLPTGRERWKIAAAGDEALGIAGIWEYKKGGLHGNPLLSFAMLTINADAHPLYSRYNAPGDEKRMPIILRPDQYDAWLHCSADEAPEFFARYSAELLVAQPSPKPTPRRQSPQQSLFNE